MNVSAIMYQTVTPEKPLVPSTAFRMDPPPMAVSHHALAPEYAERIEYRGSTLISTHAEAHLAAHSLVRDSALIGVPSPAGIATSILPGQPRIPATTPTFFVALNRTLPTTETEAKKIRSELASWISEHAPLFKSMKGKIALVDHIPRSASGLVLRHDLIEHSAVSPVPARVAGPSKGFFNTVLTSPPSAAPVQDAAPRKTGRDSKRRATHSQIERRRREKINDRLVTLRSIVPACAMQLQDRKRQKLEEQAEAARIAAGGAPKVLIDAVTGKPKRKRNRKKPETKKDGDKEEELGLHKLEVLTHAINYIFQLKAHIHELETGTKPEWIPDADDPFGKNRGTATVDSHPSVKSEFSSPTRPQSSRGEADEEDNASASASASEDQDTYDAAPQPKRRLSAFARPRGSMSSSSASTCTSPLTISPMMSLSSESPILLSPHSLPAPALRRESHTTLMKQMSITSPDEMNAAALLLNLGSNDAVRFATPQVRPKRGRDEFNRLRSGPGSAPGGAHATHGQRLASPPLLELEEPIDASDGTVDDSDPRPMHVDK